MAEPIPVRDTFIDECDRIAYLAQLQARANDSIRDASQVSMGVYQSLGEQVQGAIDYSATVADDIESQLRRAYTAAISYSTRIINIIKQALVDVIVESMSVAQQAAKDIQDTASQHGIRVTTPYDVAATGPMPNPGQLLAVPHPGMPGGTIYPRMPGDGSPAGGAGDENTGTQSGLPQSGRGGSGQLAGGSEQLQSPASSGQSAGRIQAKAANLPPAGTGQGQLVQAITNANSAALSTLADLAVTIQQIGAACGPDTVATALQQIDAVGFVIGQSQQLIVQLPATPDIPTGNDDSSSSSSGVTPVDLDQPLAFLFGERNEGWHSQAAEYMGGWMKRLLSSSTLDEFIAGRETYQVTTEPKLNDSLQFPYDQT
jgi:hypothetical protein